MQKDDVIYRQAAIDALKNRWKKTRNYEGIGDDIAEECELYLKQVPPAQPEEAIPVEWIEARIKRFKAEDNAFCGLTANIMHVMLNEWKREQEGETT